MTDQDANATGANPSSRKDFLLKAGSAAMGAAALAVAAPALSASAQIQVGRLLKRAPVALKFSLWMAPDERKALQKVLPLFYHHFPDITVKVVDVTGPDWGREKLETLIAGGGAPDVMQLNTGQFEAFASRGALMALDSYFKRDHVDLNLYVPGTWPGCKWNGKIYGTPRFLSVHCIYYNKDKFRKARVPFPRPGWTWDEFRATAKKLTDAKHHQWGFGLIPDVWAWGAFVMMNGGQILSADRKKCLLDNPRTIEALNFYFGLQFRDKVVPPPGSLPPAQNWAGAQLTAESVAMAILGPWFRPAMAELTGKAAFGWDVVTTPVSSRTHRTASTLYTDQWSASSTTAHPEEAWQLVKWLGGTEFHQNWLRVFGASSLDAVKPVVESPAWVDFGGHSGRPFLQELKSAAPPPVNFAQGGRVQDVWNPELQLVQIGQESAATAVKKICDKVDPILAQST